MSGCGLHPLSSTGQRGTTAQKSPYAVHKRRARSNLNAQALVRPMPCRHVCRRRLRTAPDYTTPVSLGASRGSRPNWACVSCESVVCSYWECPVCWPCSKNTICDARTCPVHAFNSCIRCGRVILRLHVRELRWHYWHWKEVQGTQLWRAFTTGEIAYSYMLFSITRGGL